ncbi:MAG TPA: Xaa-Pro peptidase family protein [Candidatus Angelobacter sp.]|nr:Xaa-Pro peptidase family protein [Candidatus Angelobacter sp.]
MNYSLRQQKLAAELARYGVDALLVTHLPNIRYLCGFTGSAGAMLIVAGKKAPRVTLFTDGRYTQQAATEVQQGKVTISKQPAWMAAALRARQAGVSRLGFEPGHLTFALYQELSRQLRGKVSMKPVAGLTEHLREVKDSDEIEQIREAAALGCGLFASVIAGICPGIAETTVAGELEKLARSAGAEKMSFDTIVASGPRSALPHGRASSHGIPDSGFIILDYGVILAGYCSDMTRTVHVGPVSTKGRRMYETVREAQLASIAAVKPGAEAGDVDKAGREVIRKAGFGAYFTHSTGHGVGIEIHESPRLAKGQTQKLVPGMIITIEPGVYLPDEGGVRIEDMVLVTESGCEVLTPVSKDLAEL